MVNRELLIASGLLRPVKCGKIEHEKVADAYAHGLSIALKNDGRARIYFCRQCRAYHVATDRAFEEAMNLKVKSLENEMLQIRASRDKWQREADTIKRKLDAVKVSGRVWDIVNGFLAKRGLVIIRLPKPIKYPAEWTS
jgi:hypothetical protein